MILIEIENHFVTPGGKMPRGGPVFRYEVARSPLKKTAVVASATTYSTGKKNLRSRGNRERQPIRAYQSALWDFYDSVSEYRFAVDWVGNMLSTAKLVGFEDGKHTENQDVLDAMASLFGGPEGQHEMLRLLGINFTVSGEAYLVAEPPLDEQDPSDEWSVASASEVVVSDAGRITLEGDELQDESYIIRLWKRHPRKQAEANGPSRAVLPILQEISRLTEVVIAQADSRLNSAGILWVPSELEMPSATIGSEDGDSIQAQQNIADGLSDRLIQVAESAIQDRDSAAAQVPIVIAAEGEYLKDIQHTMFWGGFDEHAKELRDEAIRRLGLGMDMPPEVLLGSSDANRWNMWQIEEASVKSHTEPLLKVITTALTEGFLRPYLRSVGVEDAERFSIQADTTAMRLRPNRSKEAMELYDRGLINARTALVENGFNPDDDEMTDQQYHRWLLQKLADGSSTPEQVAAAYRILGIEGIPTGLSHGETEEVREARPARSLKEHPERAEPDSELSEARKRNRDDLSIDDGLVFAAEQMVFRALERAGNRIKTKISRPVTVPAFQLYKTVPPESDEERDDLLVDAWSSLDSFSYPGLDKEKFKIALADYTEMLIRSGKDLDREGLRSHLEEELSGEPRNGA